MSHRWPIRVYYEDTDLAGIVYYANYLRYIERARSEMVRAAGVDQTRMKARSGLVFAVKRVEADYLSPAKFDDQIEVLTELSEMKGASFTMDQTVMRGKDRLFFARVWIVCLDATGKLVRLPADIRQKIETIPANNAS